MSMKKEYKWYQYDPNTGGRYEGLHSITAWMMLFAVILMLACGYLKNHP